MKSKKNKKHMGHTKNTYSSKVKTLKINEVDSMKEKRVSIIGIVERVVQTGGPTIFIITDGTGTLALKGFVSPGKRAYPEINEEDSIKAIVDIGEFNDELEGEIKSISHLEKNEHDYLLDSINKIEKERAKVKPIPFLVRSPILDKLKERFVSAATQIKLAIIQNRPIIVRHHNDADGYSSGFALEKAILPLIQKQHNSPKSGWEYFTRAPCAAPFYEITDSIRDTANSLRNVAKFSNKMPLIIIADNGSSPEDLMGIKQGKIHGTDFIVVDHHYSKEDLITKEVLTHINPFLIGEDGSRFSAGMLCTELARFINNDVENINQIPAMAGLADRIELYNPEVMKDYIKIAEKHGYTEEILREIAIVIEYVSTKIRFMEVREYIEVIFGEPKDKQKKLVDLMAPYIRNLDKKGLAIAKANVKIEKINDKTLQLLDIDKTFPGFGFFPKPGRAIGLVHDDLQKTKGITKLISAGVMSTAITIRATNEADFSVHELIKYLDSKLPNAFVEGGGHKNAGSINFLPNKQKDVLELMKKFIKEK